MKKIISQICLVKTVTKMVIKVAIFAFRWLKSCFGKPWRYGTLSIYVGHANDSFYFLIYVVNSCLHEGKQLLPRFKCWLQYFTLLQTLVTVLYKRFTFLQSIPEFLMPKLSQIFCFAAPSAFYKSFNIASFFGMAAMPFLWNGTLLFQGNLPRVLPVIIYKYASCLIPHIDLLLFL